MRNNLTAGLVAVSFALAAPALAQPSNSTEIAAIRAEIAALSARLERLEQATGAAGVAAPAGPAASPTPSATVAIAPQATEPRLAAAVPPNVRFSGDLRYRHESINEEDQAERQRQRIRARFGVTADVAENVRLGLTLATGGDDPVSANQSLDTGFARKPIGVDRAFFSWAATDELTFTGGKMANPFYRPGNHHLIYDNDLNPEGLALRYARGNWFANYAGLWVEERAAADDSLMLGGQFGYRSTLNEGARFTVGASYYDYLQTQGQTPFWNGDAAGNRVDVAGNYLNDFNLAELFSDLTFKPGDRPVTVFADYVVNTEADSFDTGFALGASLGEVTRAGTWRVGYIYQELGADAVLGTFTDSDWAGGGTDGKGHVVEFNYGFRDRLVFGFRYFLNDRGQDVGTERDYNRMQADVQFNY